MKRYSLFFISVFILLSSSMPAFAQSCADKETGIFKDTNLEPPGCAVDSFPQLLQVAENVLQLLLNIGAALFILFMVIAGVKFMISAESQDRIKDAKSSLTNAIVGLVIVLLAKVILNTLAAALSGG